MKTTIITGHEEEYSKSDARILGVLVVLDENHNRIDSLVYSFHNNTYIFFNTVIEMIDFLLCQDNKTKRAHMKEEEFDQYYDAPFIEGLFTEKLKWL